MIKWEEPVQFTNNQCLIGRRDDKIRCYQVICGHPTDDSQISIQYVAYRLVTEYRGNI